MGIRDLLPFLRKQVPQAFSSWTPGQLEGQRIAIDIPIWAHKLAAIDGHAEHVVAHILRGIQTFLQREKVSKIYCVLDGKKTPLKDRERQKRQVQRDLLEQKKEAKQLESHDFAFEIFSEEISNSEVQVHLVSPTSFPKKRH